MLVSPTEPKPFDILGGQRTWKVEDWGVDFLWSARGMYWGVQRKELRDLVASVEDGRLAKERLQWPSVTGHVWLVIETGERGGAAPREMPDGQLVSLGKWGRPWTGEQLRSFTYSLMHQGVGVVWTQDVEGTVARIRELVAWSRKEHQGPVKATVPRDVFGKRDDRAYGVWLLSSLPGVGAEMAGRIWDHFHGLPIGLKDGIGVKELTGVKGVGKVTAERIVKVFG